VYLSKKGSFVISYYKLKSEIMTNTTTFC